MAKHTNSGQFRKGQPSPNPLGRGAPLAKAFSSAPVASPTKPSGSAGIASPGGFVIDGERNRLLRTPEKWIHYDNMTLNVAIVSAAIGVWTQLGSSATWTAKPNARGGKDAERGADLVTEGLLDAQMSTPWRGVIRRQLMKKFRGFAMHEALIRRRADGVVVIGDLQHRPQWSVFRWDIPDEQAPWQGIEQLTRLGNRYYIPRERLFYSVENTLSDSPEGVGTLRMLAEPVRVLELYQQWEGIGFQTDLRGLPVGSAPLAKLADEAKSVGAATPGEILAYIQGQTRFMTDFLEGHSKRPDQSLFLDSATYRNKDEAQSVSSVAEWAFDIVRGAVSGMPEVGAAIGRLTRDVARIMCAEWLLLGGEDSGGAYSMHENKTAMFGLLVNGANGDIADDAGRDLAARIIALNGLDPETCTPTLVPDPVATDLVEAACHSLMMLTQAGLHPKDEAINILRSRMDLPPAPDIDDADWMLPRGAVVVPDANPTEATPDNQPLPGTKPAATPAVGAGKPGNVNADPSTHDTKGSAP